MSYQQQKQHESMGMPGIDTANKIEMKDDNEIEYLLVVNINSINDVEKVKRDSIL
jgi:GTP:adenosylcobinamide-phosphate guanylyltransferase